MTLPPIFIITGKPLSSPGGYQTYVKFLSHSLPHFQIISLPRLPLPLLALPLLAPILSLKLAFNLKPHSLVIGIGPWSLSGALIKIFSPHLRLISFYPTTVKHELSAEITARHLPNFFKQITLPLYSLLETFTLNKSDKILVHYQSAKRILMEQYNINRTKIVITPDSLIPAPQEPLVVCLSRHDARKGIPILLHALSLLSPPPKAVIGSTGPLLSFHRRLSRQLGLPVEFPGFVKNTSTLLSTASIFVLPSLEEGSSSLALLEAMRAGLPIVATKIDGIPEDITHNVSGLLVPPHNPRALARAIQKLLKNPRLARRLAKNARKAYLKKHSPSLAKSSLRRFLLSVTSHHT